MKPIKFHENQQGAVLYYALVMTVALVIIGISASRNSITAISNANLIQLQRVSNNASAMAMDILQNFIYQDMKTDDRQEIMRMIHNPFANSNGLYVWPAANGTPLSGYTQTYGSVDIDLQNFPAVSVTTKTQFLKCIKTSGTSAVAEYFFKTTVSVLLNNQDRRQEQHWKMLGVTNNICG